MDLKPSLPGLSLEELEAAAKKHGFPAFRGRQLAAWVYSKHVTSWDEARNLPAECGRKLGPDFDLTTLECLEIRRSSTGESTKFLFRTRDQQLLESVLITQQGRHTVCVSTQVGCKIGCVFCASGKGKFGRNLTPGEIVEQVGQIERETGKVTNVVFMGMGEPLDNFEATMKAIDILQAPWGFALGARRITVSTSGITPRIVEFVKRCGGRVRLSVSLHSSQEAKRTELVPVNKRYSLKELVDTLNHVHRTLKRDITFEYTLIDGINDDAREAEGVARIARPLQAKVNLIPYNPIQDMEYKTPSPEKVARFQRILEDRGVKVIVRQTAGRDIAAACGQLRRLRENPS